jgi:hypothetical protein
LPPFFYSKYRAAGLVILSVLAYFSTFCLIDASQQMVAGDDVLLKATRPFVVMNGAYQEQYNVGDHLTITANFTSHDDQDQTNVVVIVEVRDSAGITTLLYATPANIQQDSRLDVTVPWIPEDRDAYIIRTYALTDLVTPRLLTEPTYWKTVVIDAGADHMIDSVAIGNHTNGLPRMISKTNISNTPIGSGYSYMYVSGDTVCIVYC